MKRSFSMIFNLRFEGVGGKALKDGADDSYLIVLLFLLNFPPLFKKIVI